jgi:chromosome segregation ATPase
MASFFGEGKTNSDNILREIQTERMIYQINSSSDSKKAADKMKKGIEEITKAMENARNTAYEKKIATDDLKIGLSEKKDKMKKLQQELERTGKRIESVAKKTLDLEIETSKIKNAIERIEEVAQDLGPKYLEQSQNELMDSLVKATLEAEKAQSDLNAAKKMQVITSKKARDIEIDFSKSEAYTLDKISETERIIANVSSTIEHIIRIHDEITLASKDLLKSAISTTIEFEQNQPYQEVNDTKVTI